MTKIIKDNRDYAIKDLLTFYEGNKLSDDINETFEELVHLVLTNEQYRLNTLTNSELTKEVELMEKARMANPLKGVKYDRRKDAPL